jgi:hypothetical protein
VCTYVSKAADVKPQDSFGYVQTRKGMNHGRVDLRTMSQLSDGIALH